MGGLQARPLGEWPMLGDPDGQWERWFETFGVQPPARYAAVFDDSESHHRAALDGVGVALGRVTRARLLLDSGQLVMLTAQRLRSEEHTSELQSLMRISYAVFCFIKKT